MSVNLRKRKLKRQEVSGSDSVSPKVAKSDKDSTPYRGKSLKFRVKDFRKKLSEDDFISDFVSFLNLATENEAIIQEYLEVGGQPLEIVQCLEKIDKNSLDHVTSVLRLLQLILIEILSQFTQHTTIAVNGCRFLLRKQRGCLEALLESHATNHRKIALNVLTACVTLDSRMGFDVLKLFRSHITSRSLTERFTKLRKEEIDHPESSLRTAFIHFVLAYLVEGNSVLTQNILDKMELLVAVLDGLQFDTAENIVLVLGTLRNFILKKVSVSKTQKFHLFSAEIVCQLLELYKWRGPEALQSPESASPPAEKVEMVSAAVQDFLLLLLTSNKHGLVVQSLGNQKKKNYIPSVVLKSLQTPWRNDLNESLVIRVLKACPEQVEFFLRARAKFLDGDHQMISFLVFLEKLISSLGPKILQKVIKGVGMTEMSSLLKNICFPPEILEKIRERTLKNATFAVRLHVTKLLTTMLTQSSSYLHFLNESEAYQDFELKIIKQDLFEHVLGKFPSMDTITRSLYRTIDEQRSLASEDVLQHLETTVDLLTIAVEIIPTFIDKTTSLINYMQLMGPLHAQESENQENHSRIELKIIKLILQLDPQVVSPGTALFSSVVTSFLNIYCFGGSDGQEVETLLRNILFSTRLFDAGPLEIDIWLEAFRCVDKKHLNVVQAFFVKLINKIKSQPQDFDGIVAGKALEVPSGENLRILERIERNEATLGIVDVPGLNNLLPIAVQLQSKKSSMHVVKYLESVVLNLFHYLPNSNILPPLIEKLALGVSDYMTASGNATSIEGESPTLPCEFSHPEVSKLIKNITRDKIFEDLNVQSDGKAFNLIYLVLFLHTRFQLDPESSSLCSKYLVNLLESVHQRQVSNSNKKRSIELHQAIKVKIDRENPLKEILKYIFSEIHLLNKFSDDLDRKSRPSVDLVLSITGKIKDWDTDFPEQLTVNFRNKLVQKFKENPSSDEEFMLLIKTLALDQENCLDLLKILTQRGEFHEILPATLQRVTELGKKPLPCEVIKEICGIFIAAEKGASETSINALSDALTDHLSHFHCSIGHVPRDLLHSICVGGRNTKSLTKLAMLLLQRDASLLSSFRKTLDENFTKKELMYPLLSVALARKDFSVDEELLERIFKEYKNGIIKSIEKPQKAGVIYRENFFASIRLIEECMSQKDCTEFAKRTLKPDSVETFQCLLIEKIFQKAERNPTIHVNFFKNFLNLTTFLLKKPTLQVDKLKELVRILTTWSGDSLEPIDFSPLTESSIWTNFFRTSLKIGLQQDQDDESRSLLIHLLASLINRVYPDDSGVEFARELYEMIFSHSNFMRILLKREKSDTKIATAQLLLILARKNISGFDKTHIPLFLGAYGAKMSRSDRYILALMCLYEKNGVDLSEFRPLLWGESAISHYSLEAESTIQGILEEPSMDMVMSIISPDTMKNTLSNFPIWRLLNPLSDSTEMQSFSSSKSEIEMIIDGNLPKNSKLAGLLTKKQDTWDEVYDPAFFVPLVSAMFAPEVLTSTVAVAQNGLLGMVLEALSSEDEDMRLAAGLALMRYKRQMEGRKEFLDRNVWLQFYGGIQNGLATLGKVTGSSCPRLSHVSANFFAKASIVLTTPLAHLYRPIADYVLSKESFDLSVVPNFNFMFLSADVDHQQHREFLLTVLVDGVKCEEDIDVLQLCGALETIMVFFSCPFASIDTNLRILCLINTIVRVPCGAKSLLDRHGLVPWLSGVIGNLETFYYDTIDAIVHIIVNLWYSVEYLEGDQGKICHLAVKMVRFLSTRMPMTLLAKFIRVLNSTSHGRHHLLPPGDLDHLIECAKPLIEDTSEIQRIRENGAEFAESGQEVTVPDERKVALINLRHITMNSLLNKLIQCTRSRRGGREKSSEANENWFPLAHSPETVEEHLQQLAMSIRAEWELCISQFIV